MELQYTLTFDDFAAAQSLHAKRSAWPNLVHLAGYYFFPILGICMLALVFFTKKPGETVSSQWLTILCGAYLLACPLILRLTMKRRYTRTQSGTGDCLLNLDEHLIKTQGQHSKSEIEWKAVKSSSEDFKVFLLYLAPGKFLVIPKRICSQEHVAELRTILQNQVGPLPQ